MGKYKIDINVFPLMFRGSDKNLWLIHRSLSAAVSWSPGVRGGNHWESKTQGCCGLDEVSGLQLKL